MGNPAELIVPTFPIYVNIVDENGCVYFTQFKYSKFCVDLALTTDAPKCEGQPITLNVSASVITGFQNYQTSFQWSNGASGASTTVSTAGAYDVTCSIVGGVGASQSYCAKSASITVETFPLPEPVIEGQTTICPGETVELIATGGPFATHNWFPLSGQDETLSIQEPGNYSLSVTNEYGCKGTDNFTVTGLPGTNVVIIGPPQITCADTAVMLKIPGMHHQILWSTGADTSSILVNTGGMYSVTVTNAYGCTAEDSHNLTGTTVLQPLISGPQGMVCPGDTVHLEASANFSSYLWTGGYTTAGIDVTQGGVYTVTVTNTLGCSATKSFTLNVSPVVQPSLSLPTCAGNTLQLTALGGPFALYAWSNGDSTAQATLIQGGNYSLTVANAAGCTATATTTIDNVLFATPSIVADTYVCDGSLSLHATPGFEHYLWSTSDTLSALTVSSSGLYSLTTTNAAGCTATALLGAQIPPPPVTALSGGGSFCQLSDLHLTADPGFSAYNWSSGQVNVVSISPDQPGDYTVTVTDVYGCTALATTSINLHPESSVQIAGPQGFCPGAAVALEATPGFAAYLWNTGETTSSISLSQSKLVSLTITDVNGCTAESTVSVGQFSDPVAQITGPGSICNGGQANLSVSGNFMQYEWSDGTQSGSITTAVGGEFSVTVTDANGCRDTAYYTLTTGAQLSPTIAVQPNWCQSSVTLDAGPGYSNYNWSGGFTGSSITVHTPGSYNLMVSDASGCSGTAQTDVTIPAPLSLSLSGPAMVCPGAGAVLQASAGFVGYTWPDGPGDASWQAPHSGDYTVTATDAHGCTTSAAFSVGAFNAPAPLLAGPAAICAGDSVLLSVSPAFAAYEWSTGDYTPAITVHQSKTYDVTVTDDNGCTGSVSHFVDLVSAFTPTVTVQIDPCLGIALLNASQGYVLYQWSSGAQTPVEQVDASGNYDLTVSDEWGCTATTSVSISIPPPSAVGIVGPTNICPGAVSTLQATPGFVVYEWLGGEASATLPITQGGDYALTVTDSNGCTANAVFTVNEWAAPAPLIDGPAAICVGEVANLSIEPVFNYYQWSEGSTGTEILATQSGAYQLTVTDANGCTGTGVFVLTVHDLPTPEVTELPYQCDGTLSLQAPPGSAQYEWSNGFSGAILQVSASGFYTLTATDTNGCKGIVTAPAVVPPLPVVTVSGIAAICQGGIAMLSATSGFDAYQWSSGQTGAFIAVMQPGNYGVIATDAWGCTAAADFSVTVHAPDLIELETLTCFAQDTGVVAQFLHNQYGCDSTIVVITRLSPPMLIDVVANSDYNGSAVSCAGASDGSAQALVSGGTAPLSYQWSNGATNASLNGLPPGGLGLTITDAAGCSKTVGLLL
ncbi:MAG: SprB repeat-containing protein, partial [Saprospiraceae bacterium]|nr:SprB repeat-containing protein [Saprospiraceae bacterium]